MSTDFGKQGNRLEKCTLPPFSIFPRSCSIAVHSPFCPLGCAGPWVSADGCARLTTVPQTWDRAANGSKEHNTPKPTLLLMPTSHQRQTRRKRTACLEKPGPLELPSGEHTIFLQPLHRIHNYEVEVCHQKNSLMMWFLFYKISNWILPSSQHLFLHTEVIVV